jgi:hypothetical protein
MHFFHSRDPYMEISLDFLSQVPRLLRELTGIVQETTDKRRQRRIEFFDQEIAPAHADMQAINDDYMASFSELLGLLKSKGDLDRTIELLKKKRLVMLTTRSDRLASAKALTDARKTSYIKKREIAAFVDYSEAIRAYLRDASPGDARFSWYSAFIDEFEHLASYGRFPEGEFASISSSGPPVDLIRRAYDQAIQVDIPCAWEKYSTAYHQLRLELKR